MRLMPWNIQSAESPGSKRVSDLDGIAQAISSQSPDIVFLQEVALGPGSVATAFPTIRDVLGMDGRFGVASRGESRATAVLWRPQAARFRKQTTHYGDLFYHGITLVELDVDDLARPLSAASVHLHPHSADARVVEVSVLHMKADQGQLTVVAGDFNSLGAGFPVK